MKLLIYMVFLVFVAGCADKKPSSDLFRQDNLVAWCIVPFDKNERSPEERAAMLQRLGIQKFAYDWREKHVPEFEAEILMCQKYGIEYFAFWGEHPEAFALFEKYNLHPQIWKTLPSPQGNSQEERVELAGKSMLPLVEKTRELGCKFGLYNHGGWGGEPENLVAVVDWLRANTDAEHVGLVYNLHHGHEHISHFKESLELMLPYLHCLNLNGMNSNGDPKILALGKGEHEEALLRIIKESGYDGPIGILGHQSDLDAEIALKENLEGLRAIQSRL
jgi:sugar phosphate isomerase/epimerase